MYIDDILFGHNNYRRLKQITMEIAEKLKKFGLPVNMEKSKWDP
jgi:DNA-directed RNA polymerase alpha subunit